jgi:hypothetical protein
MTLNYVTLTGTLPNAGGAVLQAVLSGWTPDATDELLFPPAGPPPVTLANVTVGGQPAGTFSLGGLVANDNANLPAGTYWTVSIKGIAGVPLFQQNYVLDYAAGASQDISGLASYTAPAAVTPVMPQPSGIPTAGQVPEATGVGQASAWTTPSGGKVVSGQFLCAPNAWAPASLTSPSTTSATYSAVSSGNACTGSFTAPPSGSVLVTATFVYHQATAVTVIGWALAATGTVTPLVGNAVQVEAANVTLSDVTTVQFPVTGLTPGTSYNFDLLFATSSASDALSVLAQAITATTLTANKAGPVVMTVQAV